MADRRAAILRAWIERAAPEIEANFHVRLWNGELVPLAPEVTSDMVLAVNAPQVVRRLVLAPGLVTLAQLHATGMIDIEGGTPLDLARHYDHLRVVRFARSLSRIEMARAFWPFLVGRAEPPATGDASYAARVEARHEAGRADKDLIAHHYDVSNAFYALFLDPEMVYSNGYFASPDTPLAEAARAKLDLVCRKLLLEPGDRMLDIGCGWGGLACHAARHYGARVHGVTLSEEQHAWCREKIAREGLDDLVTVELADYRTIPPEGQFDKVCQTGMFEHVGIDNHDAFFRRVHDLLRPGGIYFHEAVTRPVTPDPRRFRRATAYQRFITRYIFPGGELDYLGLTTTNMERRRLEVIDVENVREHYRLSLIHWVERLQAAREEAVAEAGEARTRLWLLYMSLFAIAFERGTSTTFQIVGTRRRVGSPPVPMTRDHLRLDNASPLPQLAGRVA